MLDLTHMIVRLPIHDDPLPIDEFGEHPRDRLPCIAELRAGVRQLRPIAQFALLGLMCTLQGCEWPATPSAPSPTANPNPKVTSHLKISVQEDTEVNKVEVTSLWTVGNIGCAPIHPVSGAAVVKQVDVAEKVEKVGAEYIATIVEDRFADDPCHWLLGGWQVRFMHNDEVRSVGGAVPSEFHSTGKLELTCIPPPYKPPLCGRRSNEAFDRSHFSGVFNATLEKTE